MIDLKLIINIVDMINGRCFVICVMIKSFIDVLFFKVFVLVVGGNNFEFSEFSLDL